MELKMELKYVIILIGAPGSGKSTFGKQFAETRGYAYVCPDEFRAKLGWGEGDQSVSAAAFGMAKGAIGNALDSGKSVVFDATNMYRKTRKDFINIARGRGAKTHAIVFEVDKPTLLDRNKKRGNMGGRNVPEDVIDKMLEKYQPPSSEEFDIIQYMTKL